MESFPVLNNLPLQELIMALLELWAGLGKQLPLNAGSEGPLVKH